MTHLRNLLVLLFAASLAACGHYQAQINTIEDVQLRELLVRHRAEAGVPAGAVLVMLPDGRNVTAVDGVRQLGSDNRAQGGDAWHLGSLGKSMTAMAAARLVECRVISFDTTIGSTWPEVKFRPDVARITLEDLLTQTSGLRDPENVVELVGEWMQKPGQLQAVRDQFALVLLDQPPASEPGAEFVYANTNYVIAGRMLEIAAGKPWEKIIGDEFFLPLSMVESGFGAPGAQSEEPANFVWGHDTAGEAPVPIDPRSPHADNPPFVGPAGTIFMTLADYARYGRDQMAGEQGRGLLFDRSMYSRAHDPKPDMRGYAFGWGARIEDGHRYLTHTGSNDSWYALVRLYPDENLGFLVVTNTGDESAANFLRGMQRSLVEAYVPKTAPQDN